MLKNFFTFSRLTLFVALCISAIAAWYSVIGLTAIFAGAVLPIIIMGSVLEVAKITTTVWLHHYWSRAGYAIRTYLTIAVVALACLTSMGIFGLLSKAHLEQGVVGGEVQSKVALLDEKIKIQRENIDTARRALAQMDAQVDQRLARGDSENSAERAVAIRRQQGAERTRLLKEIGDAQTEINRINEERAPVASQLRKVEAEVGPIKYIAALIYGDNPDSTTLERAVRWVTILIVAVFDPLAIVLILAANQSLRWEREDRKKIEEEAEVQEDGTAEQTESVTENMTPEPHEPEPENLDVTPEAPVMVADSSAPEPPMEKDILEAIHNEQTAVVDDSHIEEPPTQLQEPVQEKTYNHGNYIMKYTTTGTPPVLTYLEGYGVKESVVEVPTAEEPAVDQVPTKKEPIIQTEGVTKEVKLKDHDEEYTTYNGKKISWDALKQLRPDIAVGMEVPNQILFGSKFPGVAKSGDIYTRVDVVPNTTYKFNGKKWIELDRTQNTSYLQNIAYIQYLISKIDKGEYDAEFLTEAEQEEITDYLKRLT